MEFKFVTDYRVEDYILNTRWEDFPEDVKKRAVNCWIDLVTAFTLGSRGKQFEVGLRLAEAVYAGGEIPVIGSGKQFSFLGAVVAMSHAVNSFDIDDGHNLIKGHPGAAFSSGLLAAALSEGATYKEFLTALVVCYEVTIRIGLAIQKHYDYYHNSGAYGAYGTAAAAGRIFGLDRQTLNTALSIAEYHAPMSATMRSVQYPSMNKDGIPFGSMVGATAVLEALYGSTGRGNLLETPEFKYLADSLGQKYEILNLYFKPYTSCRWAHQPIRACIDLLNDNNVNYKEIEAVKVYTFVYAAALSKIIPETTDEAQYNIAYPMASAIVHRDFGYSQVSDDSLGDADVLEMMKRIEFNVDNELEAVFPAKRLAWVEIRLKDGTALKSKAVAAPGEAEENVGIEWITEKFTRLTAPMFSREKQKRILNALTGDMDIKMVDIVDRIND